MTEKNKPKSDFAHRLREAVHGTQEFLFLDRDELVHHAETHLDRVEQEIENAEHTLHSAGDSTRVSVSEALGDLRGRHAEALRRLRQLQATDTDSAKQSLADALIELRKGVRDSFGD